jgi:F0F1-type ATP synthase delta subunit
MNNYVRLLEAVAKTGDTSLADTTITKFIVHLKATGRIRMLPRILQAMRDSVARHKTLAPRVEVADKKDSAHALQNAERFGITAQEVSINQSLISGWRAQGQGKVIDHSAKRALISMYQKIIA